MKYVANSWPLTSHRAHSGTTEHQCHSTDRLWHPGFLGSRTTAECQWHPQRIWGLLNKADCWVKNRIDKELKFKCNKLKTATNTTDTKKLNRKKSFRLESFWYWMKFLNIYFETMQSVNWHCTVFSIVSLVMCVNPFLTWHVRRLGTGDSMREKQQQTGCGQQDWKHLPECLDFDQALDTTSPFWHTIVLAQGRPHHAPPSPPGNHVWLVHSTIYTQSYN